MMHPRWLALPLAAITGFAAVTGCATVTEPAPRLLSPDLHVGTLDQRTRFELDDRGTAGTAERDAPDDEGPERRPDTPEKQRRRKLLYVAGIVGMGVGVGGLVAFGVGGRIVQAQLRNGYEDGDLMREREEQLHTTGKVMNGLTIGTAVVGILGLVTAATVYGIDHARCGELRPRRKDCRPEHEAAAGDQAPADAAAAPADPATTDAAAPRESTTAPSESTAPGDTAPAPTEVGPAPASPPPAGASPAPASPSASKPGAAAPPAGKPSPGAAPGR